MGRIKLNPGTLLAPVPAVLVTCGDENSANIMTAAWTGILCTKPPVMYIAVRPERHSYGIIKERREFAVNLTTAETVRQTDLCGVRSGKNIDKFSVCGFHKIPADVISAPLVEECPLALECKVRKVVPIGSHHIFTADIVSVSADEKYIDENGKIDLKRAGLMAYSHGEYFSLGKKLGKFGFSVEKKKKQRKYSKR